MVKSIIKRCYIYLILIALSVVIICCKENFHVDEIFSYVLANSVKGGGMRPEDGQIYEPAEEVYLEYMTVQPGGGLISVMSGIIRARIRIHRSII